MYYKVYRSSKSYSNVFVAFTDSFPTLDAAKTFIDQVKKTSQINKKYKIKEVSETLVFEC